MTLTSHRLVSSAALCQERLFEFASFFIKFLLNVHTCAFVLGVVRRAAEQSAGRKRKAARDTLLICERDATTTNAAAIC